MALIDNLISYWSLDEASGTRADSHGSNDLTDNNFTGSDTGKVGNAADLEQMSQHYLSHVDNADLSTGDIDCSFSLWVKPESLSGFPMILSKGSEVGTDREYALYVDTSDSNRLVWQYGTFGAGHVLTSASGLSNGVWAHIVVGYDSVNNQQFMYINGVAETPITNTQATLEGTDPLQLGAGTSQGLYWDGLIDEFGFWKRVLTSSEVTELYNGGNGRDYSYIAGVSDTDILLTPLVVVGTGVSITVSVGTTIPLPVLSGQGTFAGLDVVVGTTVALPVLSANATLVPPTVSVDAGVLLPVLSAIGTFGGLEITSGATILLPPLVGIASPAVLSLTYGNEVTLLPLLVRLTLPTLETTGGVTPVPPILARTLDFSYTLNATLDFQYTLSATLDHGTP